MGRYKFNCTKSETYQHDENIELGITGHCSHKGLVWPHVCWLNLENLITFPECGQLFMDNKASLTPATSMSPMNPREEAWYYIFQNPLLTVIPGFYMTVTSTHSTLFEDSVWGDFDLVIRLIYTGAVCLIDSGLF